MSGGTTPPGYKLLLSRHGAAPRVERVGPSNVTQVGVGCILDKLPELAALLFPVCARAQAAAALSAGEEAAGIELSSAQRAARNAIVLAESLAACIWRCGLTWPELLDLPAKTDLVRNARQASMALEQAIYPTTWMCPGGADIRSDGSAIKVALSTFESIIEQLAVLVPRMKGASERRVSVASRPLGDDLHAPDIAPGTQRREETPRSLYATEATPVSLSDWFDAQWQHTETLFNDLRASLAHLDHEDGPELQTVSDGVGLGVSMTARGRLRHKVELKDGTVTRWDVAAPTDWNLAAGGLLVELAAEFDSSNDMRAEAKWAIAAVDPCAPCAIEWMTEAVHA